MFSFIDYVHEVFTISTEKRVDVGIAFSMLKTDIRSGNRFNTGDVSLPGFDFEAAHRAFQALSEDEQLETYGEWFHFMRHCYEDACRAWGNKNRLAVVVAGYRAQYDR